MIVVAPATGTIEYAAVIPSGSMYARALVGPLIIPGVEGAVPDTVIDLAALKPQLLTDCTVMGVTRPGITGNGASFGLYKRTYQQKQRKKKADY